jgi:hypothetical protein
LAYWSQLNTQIGEFILEEVELFVGSRVAYCLGLLVLIPLWLFFYRQRTSRRRSLEQKLLQGIREKSLERLVRLIEHEDRTMGRSQDDRMSKVWID